MAQQPHQHGPGCEQHHDHAHHEQGAHDHHHHEHSHYHPGGHHHHHASDNLRLAFFLNAGFALIEIFGGIFTNSMAILSDALHDLGDSFSLGLAWYFQKKSEQKRDAFFTYGYRRFSVLAALINALVLLLGSGVVLYQALPRLLAPQMPEAKGMMLFALLGIVVNGVAVLRLKKGHSLNEKAVALHLLEDVLGWAAVLLASIVMIFVELPWLDPLLSLLITGYVLVNVFKNIKGSLRIFLQGVPFEINEQQLRQQLLALPGVVSLHDLHIWSLDGSSHVLTLHLVTDHLHSMEEAEALKQEVRKRLKPLHFKYITIEIESRQLPCGQAED